MTISTAAADVARSVSGPTEFELAGDGVRLSAEAQGDPAGGLVILLHGGGQSRSAWRGAAAILAEHGYRAVSIDLRGHGASGWAEDGDYSFERHIADIVAAIMTLGGPVVLVGASLGGHVSLLTAAARPDLVRALVLADVTPFLDETVADGLRERLRSGAGGFATIDEAAAMIGRVGGAPVRRASEKLREHLREGDDGRLYWRWDPRVIEDRFVRHAGEGGKFGQAAARLSVPTLALRAEHSTITSPEQIARFREVVPQLEVIEMPGIGHMLTGDSNRAYSTPILEFLGRVSDGAQSCSDERVGLRP